MPKSSKPRSPSPAAEALVADLFGLGGVGYVALGAGGDVLLRLAEGVHTDTSDESNFFEELLVNPTLLKLAGQRGELDCGGLDHIAVGYGDFTQLILPMDGGHVSLGVARTANVRDLATRAHGVLAWHACNFDPPEHPLFG